MTVYFPKPVATTTFSSNSYTGGSVPTTFDACLYRPLVPNQLKLTIKLRIKPRQLPPQMFPVLDWDNKPFWTLPWTALGWQQFVRSAEAQANMWNNNFWLLPPTIPSGFSEFDQVFDTFPNQALRPTIRCELAVDFNATDDVHRTIDVANLNLAMLVGQAPNAGTFRSSALLYDSLDGVLAFRRDGEIA
jgi:hypothetical protein